MKFFWKYIFPALFGLLTYASIRLVNDTTIGESFWDRPWQQNTIEVVIVVIMGYLLNYILWYFLRKFNKRKNVFRIQYLAVEFGQIFIAGFIGITITLYITHYLIKQPVRLNDFVIGQIIVLLYMLLYYAIVRGNNLLKDYIEQQVKMQKVQNDHLQTELKFLKAQFHPHFLFNALNTIYFQMDESVETAKKTVEQFSELLRHQLYDHQQQVTIKQELDYLQNFIDLQKLRTSDKLRLEVCFDKALNNQKVYPLLLLPMVENAFKYVGGNYALTIKAVRKEDGICFCVANDVPAEISFQKMGGIGLENLKRRLELLYPNAHQFNARRKNDCYVAELFIKTDN